MFGVFSVSFDFMIDGIFVRVFGPSITKARKVTNKTITNTISTKEVSIF